MKENVVKRIYMVRAIAKMHKKERDTEKVRQKLSALKRYNFRRSEYFLTKIFCGEI